MLTSKLARFQQPGYGDCSTRGWRRRIEWSRSVREYYERGGKYRAALDRALDLHARKLPSVLAAGQELVTELDDEGLFPDNLFLMTACGSNPSWERARPGRARLFTLFAFSSSF